jgi:hypothetical protein
MVTELARSASWVRGDFTIVHKRLERGTFTFRRG